MSGRARLVDVVPLRELMGGSLAGIPSQEASRVGCCGGLVDMLLGPEGTRCVRVFLGTTWTWPAGRRSSRSGMSDHLCGGWFCVSGGVCVLFENWTVDASIFNESKCVRAHGGCLGTRSR